MGKYNREQYLKQVEIVFLELKKLKEIKGISGDMDISDELRTMNEFLEVSSYDWNIILEPLMDMAKNYLLHTDIPLKNKENTWDLLVTFINIISRLSKYSTYISSWQTLCEEILAEEDNVNY